MAGRTEARDHAGMPQLPNILWICTDSQRWDTVAALGNPAIRTPNLDALCRRGTAFTRAYSQSPICTPSRASFMTGRYPSAIRVPRNGNATYPGHAPLLTKALSDAGWDCGLAGKLHIAGAWHGLEARGADGFSAFHYSHAHGMAKGLATPMPTPSSRAASSLTQCSSAALRAISAAIGQTRRASSRRRTGAPIARSISSARGPTAAG